MGRAAADLLEQGLGPMSSIICIGDVILKSSVQYAGAAVIIISVNGSTLWLSSFFPCAISSASGWPHSESAIQPDRIVQVFESAIVAVYPGQFFVYVFLAVSLGFLLS